ALSDFPHRPEEPHSLVQLVGMKVIQGRELERQRRPGSLGRRKLQGWPEAFHDRFEIVDIDRDCRTLLDLAPVLQAAILAAAEIAQDGNSHGRITAPPTGTGAGCRTKPEFESHTFRHRWNSRC